jgi:hypothetical protein
MKLVELINADTYLIEYKGERWHFVKGKIRQVPPLLADKLLATGDFIDIITSDPEFAQGEIINTPNLVKDSVTETIIPLSSLPKDFNKLEVVVDLKKDEKVKPKRKYRKREK